MLKMIPLILIMTILYVFYYYISYTMIKIMWLIIISLLLQVSLHWNLVAEAVHTKGVTNEGFQSDVSGLADYGYKSGVDHSPHELFVKLDELQGGSWVEKSR